MWYDVRGIQKVCAKGQCGGSCGWCGSGRGAFGKIVTSLVNDIIMPILGLILGRIDLTSLKIVLRPANEITAELAVSYGKFLQNALDF